MRLDSYLALHWPEYSRSSWQKYTKAGFVCVNNLVETQIKRQIGEDDVVSVNIPENKSHTDLSLPIIYKDENVIVIDKPAGILSHSKGPLNHEFTVADFFKRYSTYNIQTNRPGIIHRLDRDTSGVLVGALNPETAQLLQKEFSDRKVYKTYVALIDGIPDNRSAIIDLPIGRNPRKPSQFRVDPNGKSAQTRYDVVEAKKNHSLVELKPITGRTHQLRVHMAHLGTPIHGDRVYGGEVANRLYLHAAKIEITIPGGKRMVFESKVPVDFLTNNLNEL